MAESALFSILLKFFLIPLAIAAVMYLLAFIQLSFIKNIIKVDISAKMRTRMCIATFFIFFLATAALAGVDAYLS